MRLELDEILILRPPEGADSATIAAAISNAAQKRTELLMMAATADQVRADGLLVASDKAMLKAEQDAAHARLAVERIDALIPKVRLDLEAAQARDKMAVLHAKADEITDLMGALSRWQAEHMPSLMAAIRDGFALHDKLAAATSDLKASVETAYRDPLVRELGQFTPDLTAKGVPDMGRLPRNLFPLLAFG